MRSPYRSSNLTFLQPLCQYQTNRQAQSNSQIEERIVTRAWEFFHWVDRSYTRGDSPKYSNARRNLSSDCYRCNKFSPRILRPIARNSYKFLFPIPKWERIIPTSISSRITHNVHLYQSQIYRVSHDLWTSITFIFRSSVIRILNTKVRSPRIVTFGSKFTYVKDEGGGHGSLKSSEFRKKYARIKREMAP